MNIPEGAAYVLNKLRSAGYEAYAVGGCVRDSLMDRTPHDWDLCTGAMPQEMKAVFAGDLRQKDIGIAHGTVTFFYQDEPIEVTTFRLDGKYTDHRRPDKVVLGVPLRQDLARRDFTINAMAMGTDGQIVDYFNGREDLQNKIIRCVGEPRARFTEDALRILRALRFASQLDFAIEPETLQAAKVCSPLLKDVARERVFAELDALLQGPGAGRVLACCGDILAKVIPAVGRCVGFDLKNPVHELDLWQHTAKAVGISPARRNVRWALMLHDLAKPDCFLLDEKGIGHAPEHGYVGSKMAEDILHELHAPSRLTACVRLLVKYHDNPLVPKDVSVRRWMARLGIDLLEELIEVRRADLAAHAECGDVNRRKRQVEAFAQLEQEVKQQHPCVSLNDMEVNGRDLIRAGLCRPGPQTGRLLHQLLFAVINGETENKKADLIDFARQLAAAE